MAIGSAMKVAGKVKFEIEKSPQREKYVSR